MKIDRKSEMWNKVKRAYIYLLCVMAVAEVALVLMSWLLSATMTEGVRSMLSGEGVRWFFGSFVHMMLSPWLVWLLLSAMALGCLWRSGLLNISIVPSYRHRVALRTIFVVAVLYVAVIVSLTAVPHAVLLSATGQLVPSAFSRALVSIVTFGICLVSVVYGLMSGRFETLSDAVDSLSYGIAKAAPLFILYVFIVQFLHSLLFVFF